MSDTNSRASVPPFPPDYRASGVLLHVTSLPSPYGIGDLGPAARAWIEQLRDAGQRWWQALPLGPTGCGNSRSVTPPRSRHSQDSGRSQGLARPRRAAQPLHQDPRHPGRTAGNASPRCVDVGGTYVILNVSMQRGKDELVLHDRERGQ